MASRRIQLTYNLPAGDDFTVYVRTGDLMQQWGVRSLPATIDDVFETADAHQRVVGRGLACRCYRGGYYSISIRAGEARHRSKNKPLTGESATDNPLPDTSWDLAADPKNKSRLDLGHVVTSLNDTVWSLEGHNDGALIVFGRTNSGKSKIARALTAKYLRHEASRGARNRNVHVVTVEDPVEEFLRPRDQKDSHPTPELLATSRIDYTPRELGRDVRTVRNAMRDALRQTPDAVYVGEVRSDRDWRDVFHFAGTGHLLVATAHASSLVEGMRQVMRAMRVTTKAERGAVARRLLSVVHLRRFPHENYTAQIPTVWRRCAAAVSTLVTEGFGSVLPMNRNDEDVACIGRRWYARSLLTAGNAPENAKNAIEQAALREDLQGL